MAEKTDTKLTAADWLRYFSKADLLTKQLAEAKSEHAKSIMLGKFLSRNINRVVPIQVKGRSGHATLRVETGRSDSRHYFFQVVWDSVPEQATPPEAVTDKVSAATEKPATDKTSRGTKKLTTPVSSKTAKPGTGATVMKEGKDGSVAAKTPTKPSVAGNDEGWD